MLFLKRFLKFLYLPLSKYSDALNTKICKYAARKRAHGLASFMVRISTKELKKLPNHIAESGGKYRILTLSRSIFNEDIIESLGSSNEFKIYLLPRRVIKAFSSSFLPSHVNDSNYLSADPDVEKGKLEYKNFLIEVWEKLRKDLNFDAVLTGNFGYHAERELAGALESIGIPFLALHKENLKSPGLVKCWIELYRERRGCFSGRKIMVYNQIEKDIESAANIFPQEKILVTGMPRLDKVHRWRISNAGKALEQNAKPQILFFAFSPDIGLPSAIKAAGYEHEDSSKQWLNLSKSTFATMIAIAEDNPAIKVIIKMKKTIQTGVEEALSELISNTRELPNLQLAYGGDPFSLITKSNVICGYNSTALLEAIAADKRVVVPHFEEALDEDMMPYIVDLEDAVDYSDSPEHLKESLISYAYESRLPRAELSPPRQRVLEKWMGNSDGQSGRRVREALVAEMARNS